MFGDGTSDRVIDALRTVIAVRVNAAITSGWDEPGASYPAIGTTIGRPVARQWLGNESFPLLSVYRKRTTVAPIGNRLGRSATISIDVYGPQTPRDRLDERWPTMHAIAEAIVDSLDGEIDGFDLLAAAGVHSILDTSVSWTTSIALSQGSEAYPLLSMQLDVLHTSSGVPLSDAVASLPLLGSLFARYLSTEKPPSDPVIVEALHSVDGGARATLAASDPFNDEHGEIIP